MSSTSTPRETAEWRPFTVTVDGAAVFTDVETCITTGSNRPTTWTPAEIRDGKTLIRVAGLAVGTYRAWARVTRSDEIAVIELGYFTIS